MSDKPPFVLPVRPGQPGFHIIRRTRRPFHRPKPECANPERHGIYGASDGFQYPPPPPPG